jgi:hypothetical protein
MEKGFEKFIQIKQAEDKKLLFDQYKVAVESLNKINDLRETSNNYWTGLNGAIVAAISYVRDAERVSGAQKSYFIWTALVVGTILSLSWLSYLASIKKSVDMRNEMLLQLEEYFPAKIFTIAIAKMGRKQGGGSLSIKEMFVPGLFIVGYIFFAIAFYFYPRIIFSTN